MTPLEIAEEAKRILNSHVFKTVWDEVRMDLVAALEQSAMGDVDTQNKLTIALQELKQVRARLERKLGDVAMAEHRKKDDSFRDRIRERFFA